jgi:hypothetical protein
MHFELNFNSTKFNLNWIEFEFTKKRNGIYIDGEGSKKYSWIWCSEKKTLKRFKFEKHRSMFLYLGMG